MNNQERWQAYLQPNGVLKNLLNITDQQTLHDTEYVLTIQRQAYLQRHAFVLPDGARLQGKNVAEVRQIHHYLFADIYDWAGHYRDVNMGKGGTDMFFPFERFATAESDIQEKIDRFQATNAGDKQAVTQAAGELISEINWWHPFREGNGRTQRVFAQVLAHAKRYTFDIEPDSTAYVEYMQASIDDNPDEMVKVMQRHFRVV
ncbi:Fic/DOC family protein [Schleiferilactobacillus perolens]|uniref:protein adenylyltransferase n=1 Tax=Schleiferilactobacillus perolens DSM 12744 TaxID=1423792 RepID=A0A0R1MRQ6_9LACO|nr:Fic family protein [Schleiferilactobacillus perolens]KRL10041.1 cell filamentation protein Fic [Schleiferilactobacillus perolens DSM 12744]